MIKIYLTRPRKMKNILSQLRRKNVYLANKGHQLVEEEVIQYLKEEVYLFFISKYPIGELGNIPPTY